MDFHCSLQSYTLVQRVYEWKFQVIISSEIVCVSIFAYYFNDNILGMHFKVGWVRALCDLKIVERIAVHIEFLQLMLWKCLNFILKANSNNVA